MEAPKEDPEAERERIRARERAEQERREAGQKNSASLASDIQAVYGGNSLFRMIGK